MSDTTHMAPSVRSIRIDALIWRAIDAILFVVVAGLLFAVSWQATSRLMGFIAPWTEELSRALFIWTAFLGMSTGFRHGEHPRIGLLVDMLPKRWAIVSNLLAALSATILFAVVAWYGGRLMLQQIRFGETSPVLGIGMWVTTVPVILGSLLAIVGSWTALAAVPVGEDAAGETTKIDT